MLSQRTRVNSPLSLQPAENLLPDVFKSELSFVSEDQDHVILFYEIKSPQMVWTSASESFRECLEARCLLELTSEPCKEKKIVLDSAFLFKLAIRTCGHIKK